MNHHPAPRWYKVLARLFPSRCREIPEATEPGRVLLRQFAIVPRICYLQQFASGENPLYFHRHEFERVFVLVLSGSYFERRIGARRETLRIGPTFYSMDQSVVHQVYEPSANHCSIFFGWRRTGERTYFQEPSPIAWQDHVKQQVKRI